MQMLFGGAAAGFILAVAAFGHFDKTPEIQTQLDYCQGQAEELKQTIHGMLINKH